MHVKCTTLQTPSCTRNTARYEHLTGLCAGCKIQAITSQSSYTSADASLYQTFMTFCIPSHEYIFVCLIMGKHNRASANVYGTVPGVNHKFSFYNATITDDSNGERSTKTNNENYGDEGVAWNNSGGNISRFGVAEK